MSKIIEEMARDIRPVLTDRVDIGFIPDLDKPIAKTLVKLGYRKVNKDECEYWKSRCKEIGDVAYEKARKETAEKIYRKAEKKAHFKDGGYYDKDRYYLDMEDLKEILKQFGVEIKGEE